MRIATILVISISLAAGIVIGWTAGTLTPGPVPENTPLIAKSPSSAYPALPQWNPDLTRAERLLSTGRPLESLNILREIASTIDLSTDTGKEWLRLLIEGYVVTENQSQLVLIYNQFPAALSANEQAVLLVADSFLSENKTAEYRFLRNSWRGKEKAQARWVFLDVHERLAQNLPGEAVALLQTRRFVGKEETDRLTRLAALYVVNDPKRAWNYLEEALKKDPRNPDLHTFKASLGETLRQEQAALASYIAAVQNDPESPYRREQLADFYLRARQYPEALKILQDTMTAPSLDSIWLKTLFWSRMVLPVEETWTKGGIPDGSLKEFVAYIYALPHHVYWNENAFAKLPENGSYLSSQQETFWLKLMAALKNGDERKAEQLISDSPFTYNSWNPELENGIKTILAFRSSQQAKEGYASFSLLSYENATSNPEQLLALLAGLSEIPADQLPSAIPRQLHNFLLSQEAFVLPFLAAGWNEAAIQLHAVERFPDEFPDWVADSLTQALQQNRGNKAALDFALLQTSSPRLSLRIATIALALSEKQTAFDALKKIYHHEGEIGQRAALMLGQFFMEHDNPQDAKKVLLAQPSLANDRAAQEILARIAVLEGDVNTAYSLYQKLEKYSSEAKSFLARKAFVEKEWSRARQLTEELLEEHPDNSTLISNLQKIIVEEKRRPAKESRV